MRSHIRDNSGGTAIDETTYPSNVPKYVLDGGREIIMPFSQLEVPRPSSAILSVPEQESSVSSIATRMATGRGILAMTASEAQQDVPTNITIPWSMRDTMAALAIAPIEDPWLTGNFVFPAPAATTTTTTTAAVTVGTSEVPVTEVTAKISIDDNTLAWPSLTMETDVFDEDALPDAFPDAFPDALHDVMPSALGDAMEAPEINDAKSSAGAKEESSWLRDTLSVAWTKGPTEHAIRWIDIPQIDMWQSQPTCEPIRMHGINSLPPSAFVKPSSITTAMAEEASSLHWLDPHAGPSMEIKDVGPPSRNPFDLPRAYNSPTGLSPPSRNSTTDSVTSSLESLLSSGSNDDLPMMPCFAPDQSWNDNLALSCSPWEATLQGSVKLPAVCGPESLSPLQTDTRSMVSIMDLSSSLFGPPLNGLCLDMSSPYLALQASQTKAEPSNALQAVLSTPSDVVQTHGVHEMPLIDNGRLVLEQPLRDCANDAQFQPNVNMSSIDGSTPGQVLTHIEDPPLTHGWLLPPALLANSNATTTSIDDVLSHSMPLLSTSTSLEQTVQPQVGWLTGSNNQSRQQQLGQGYGQGQEFMWDTKERGHDDQWLYRPSFTGSGPPSGHGIHDGTHNPLLPHQSETTQANDYYHLHDNEFLYGYNDDLMPSPSILKRRRRLSAEETAFLIRQFRQNEKPTAQERQMFAKHLKLDRRTIQVWFQNRRAKLKRDENTSTIIGIYQHGAIVKVSMKSFVTYESCSFSPGPNLNMIIGPNGTGKSTIVCAIALGLGWSTNLLGRAKDVSEFVKHGSDKGWIEIVLYNKNGPNVVIKRHINKSNNTSVWKINGENKTQKEVMKKVQSFNIQVDNLCQFLPQDRVSEFAQMTPQELLRETQRAVGGDEMLKSHEKMIELWNEHKLISESMKGDLDSIETNEKRNAVIEKDVLRFQQREAVLRKLKLLEVWVLYAQYGAAKEEYNTVKEQRRVSLAMVKQIQAEIEPLEKQRKHVIQKERTCSEHRANLERQYHKVLQAMTAKAALVEATEGESEELRQDLNRMHAKIQQRKQVLINLKRKIATQTELVENAASDEDLNKEKDQLSNEISELSQVARNIKEKIDSLSIEQEGIVRDARHMTASLTDKRRQLVALDDIRNRRLEQLREVDGDVYEAVLWLREHRSMFQKHVFEPVCLELNIKDMKYVDAIEGVLNSHLKTFVCQTREDYNILTREVLDKLKLRVNVIAPRPAELDLGAYRPPASKEQLHEYGFDCYMLDALDGPAPLLAAICSKASIHAVPISGKSNLDLAAIRESRLFRKFSTLQDSYMITYSKYSGEPIQSASSIRRARLLTASVDQDLRNRLIREVDELQSTQLEVESKIRKLTTEENEHRSLYDENASKKDALTNRRKEIQQQLKRIEKQRIELDQLKSDLARKENEPSSEEEEARIRGQLRAKATKRCKLALEYLELSKVSSRHFSNLTIATLIRLQVQAEVHAVAEECKEKVRQQKEMEDEYTTVSERYDDVKRNAKELLDKAKEQYNTLHPDDVPEFQDLGKGLSLEELEDMLAREKAKSEMHFATNRSVIEKYEQREAEIKATRTKVEAKQKKLAKLSSDIQVIRGPWYERITALIAKISKEFSESFAKIGCAGEIKLGEHEDYDKWFIEILVKFRDSEKLQKLTGQRQSGGERSVSTIMYLMALQSMSTVSFRVVDEINQGMDPRNERLVHTQLVEKACATGTSQYFLITPKLLPNLDYHERMKVLCIYNGEWLDEGVSKWSKYLNNQWKALAQQGKIRLTRWYQYMTDKQKASLSQDVVTQILARKRGMCNILELEGRREGRGKAIYKRYASLFFCFGIDWNDNELSGLEVLHKYVECLDQYFGNVCELDIIYNYSAAYQVMDEMLLGGHAQETNKKIVVKHCKGFDKLEESDSIVHSLRASNIA
ncbi:Structural maintenance of chromosomes protein 5 [Podila epigama]|nr:Structural maintenance of chromosomes protein 5 [Podila epigama]